MCVTCASTFCWFVTCTWYMYSPPSEWMTNSPLRVFIIDTARNNRHLSTPRGDVSSRLTQGKNLVPYLWNRMSHEQAVRFAPKTKTDTNRDSLLSTDFVGTSGNRKSSVWLLSFTRKPSTRKFFLLLSFCSAGKRNLSVRKKEIKKASVRRWLRTTY